MTFFDEFAGAAETILGIGQQAADVYQQFAGTGGGGNQGQVPATSPTATGPVVVQSSVPTWAWIALGGAALFAVWMLTRKKG